MTALAPWRVGAEHYRGFIIEPNDYGSKRFKDRWMWVCDEPDLGDYYSFEDSPEECRQAIDEMLLEREELERERKAEERAYLNQPVPGDR